MGLISRIGPIDFRNKQPQPHRRSPFHSQNPSAKDINLRVSASTNDRRALIAFIAPFALFELGLALVSGVKMLAGKSDQLLLAQPMYWVYPLQALVCAVALIVFWRNYDFGSQRPLPLAVGVGLLVFVLWVSPQLFFGQPHRLDGFDPTVFANSPGLYWGTVIARFFRFVIVVPLIEEIFWRGFLQRYLINEQFTKVPFGSYTHLSFWGVTILFTSIHLMADWPAAFITGAVFGWLTVRTKSLLATVTAHAVANLALGLYIMATKQWGFW
jgi:CAAX prenyl protease-like protein